MYKSYTIHRFPKSTDKSLQAWSAADEYILKMLDGTVHSASKITIINDRFGYLSVHLNALKPNIISHLKSQEDAIRNNFELNEIDLSQISFSNILEEHRYQSDLILMKMPKSLDLFHLFLIRAYELCKSDSKVFCGFMTRHFTKQMIKIASLYFENVDQGLAWKKSRVFKLSSPRKNVLRKDPIHSISYVNHRGKNLIFKQYYGVFSSSHIDYATQFLLEHLKLDNSVSRALDLASGNGIIAHEIRTQSPKAEIHLLDDSYLAIESSKLNLKEGNYQFHYDHSLEKFKDAFFDVVVCNPPFHFEYENTIDIALKLFEGVTRILKSQGSFILVSNLHLNYTTHLTNLYKTVERLNMNSKYEILVCKK